MDPADLGIFMADAQVRSNALAEPNPGFGINDSLSVRLPWPFLLGKTGQSVAELTAHMPSSIYCFIPAFPGS